MRRLLDCHFLERTFVLIIASIPEVDDQFAVAEARCNDLQEKIDLVRSLKRKRKLKKRRYIIPTYFVQLFFNNF